MKTDSKINDTIREISHDLENVHTQKTLRPFTGYNRIDEYLQGNHPGSVILVAGRPGMGKTAFLLNVAANLSVYKNMPVCFITNDLSKKHVIQRLASSIGSVVPVVFRRAQTLEEAAKIKDALLKLSKAPLYIYESEHNSAKALAETSVKIDRATKWSAIIVDVLLLKTSEKLEQMKLAKKISQEMQCPVFVSMPIKRSVESRADTRPRLCDIYGPDEIESLVDVALLLYRDGYYNRVIDEPDSIEVRIPKNKLGGTAWVRLGWQGRWLQISEDFAAGPGPKREYWVRLHKQRKIVFPAAWIADCNSSDIKVRYLKNAFELEVEGRIQGNCIAIYQANVQKNKIQIYHGLIDEKDVTFSLEKKGELIYLTEIKARFNKEPASDVVEKLMNFLARKSQNFCMTDRGARPEQ